MNEYYERRLDELEEEVGEKTDTIIELGMKIEDYEVLLLSLAGQMGGMLSEIQEALNETEE